MNSPGRSDEHHVDFVRDVPTTAADIDALRRLRKESPTWFALTAEEFETLVPRGALERRPAIRADARPFSLVDP